MADREKRLVIDDLSGGRNGVDAPWAIRDTEVAEAINVDYFQTRFARKIGGNAAVTIGFSAGGPFAAQINWLARHVPGTDETAAEWWAADASATPIVGRMAAATTFAAPTLKDAIASNTLDIDGASVNGKFAIAYKSAVNRLHGWDGSTVRRFGLAASVAPTAADTGGGAYAAILRYYRERSTRQTGGVTIGRAEPSASVAFTPSGAGTAARVTQAAVINEGETHWEVEASLDNITFYRIATVAIGTTTYDDSAATTSYNTNPLSATTGVYTLQKSYRFIAADENRLIGYGSWTTTDKQNRVEVSAVVGSTDVGDEERVDTTTNYYIDLDENSSGPPTGLGGPIEGNYFPFKFRETWRLVPNGTTSQPFRRESVSKSVGCIADRSIVRAEDKDGNPALYWMSHRGPYRWSLIGFTYIGHGIEDLILGPLDTLSYSTAFPAWSVYHADKRQVWFFWPSVTSLATLAPYHLGIFDIQKECWSRVPASSGVAAGGICGAMLPNTLGASMSIDLKPYLSLVTISATPSVSKFDTGVANVQATITTKAYEPGGPGFYGMVGDTELMAKATSGVTITDLVTADFGVQTATGSRSIAATAAETRVTVRMEQTALGGDVRFVQHTIGDAATTSGAWTLDRLVMPYRRHDAVSQ